MTQQINYQRVVIFLAVCIVLGAAFLVLKPDRDACVAAVGRGFDAIIASDQPADASSFESEEVRSRLRWPCRFQYKQDMEAIGREVMASRLPDLFAKGLSEAFELYGGER